MPRIPTKQRYVSSELTHFVGASLPDAEAQYRILLHILQSGILLSPGKSGPVVQVGRHGPITTAKRTYSINFMERLSSNRKYQASIVCFADIPLEDLPIHMAKYSGFGLSFPRSFLLCNGANPVFYVARQSVINLPKPMSLETVQVSLADLYDSAEQALSRIIVEPTAEESPSSSAPGDPQAREFLTNHLFPFMKFFDAELPEDNPDNYYMEREWRIVGHLRFTLSDIQRVLIPREFAGHLRNDLPDFSGQLTYTD